MRSILARAGAVLLSGVLAACQDDPVTPLATSPTLALATTDSVPPRTAEPRHSFVHLSDSALWRQISLARGNAMVGFKAPGRARGVHQGSVLISRADLASALRTVLEHRGVSLVRQAADLPAAQVRLDSVDAVGLAALRRLPIVDYIEPVPRVAPQESLFCGEMHNYSLAPSEASFTALGDMMPWYYRPGYNRIEDAWVRSMAGDGILVGVLDTGIDPGQDQFFSRFNAYPDPNVSRSISLQGFDGWDDTCGHGTRIAGVIAAPHDGQNMVGIAWRSDLVSDKVDSDLAANPFNVFWAIEGMAKRRARVIEMAFKTSNWDQGECTYPERDFGFCSPYYSATTDEIAYYYRQPDGPLFIAAIGTFEPSGLPTAFYPAEVYDVVAVSGVNRDGSRLATSNYSPKVEFGGYVQAAAPGSPRKGSSGVVTLSGSSGGSATVAGIAALVFGRHPYWQNYQVRQRLREAASHPNDHRWDDGYGVIDAYKATGGFQALTIQGPYSLAADYAGTQVRVTAVPTGDGPFFPPYWSNGATTWSTYVTAAPPGQSVTISVWVTDGLENKTLSASLVIHTRTRELTKCYEATCQKG